MQSFGVSRYTMDGEPGGRVVFSCLIPLAGRQAVTQRFEAEGEDLFMRHRPRCGELHFGGPPSHRRHERTAIPRLTKYRTHQRKNISAADLNLNLKRRLSRRCRVNYNCGWNLSRTAQARTNCGQPEVKAL